MESLYTLTIVGSIFSVAFSISIWILYAFAAKFKENFLAICSIAEFLICYHEKNNPYKKWERCRENKIAGISGYESKEYFLLALSLSLFFVTVAVVVWHFITMGSFNVAVCLFMGLLDLVFLFFNIRYVILIFKATNLSKLQEERKKIKKYYKEQSETQGENMPDSCEEEKISA